MFPNHLFLSVGRSQVPGVRGGNRRVSPSTGLSDFWLPQRDEKINSNFIFVALEKKDFNVDWKISTDQMVYWNSRGSSCELISTQSPLICTSSGMIIGRSSLLIHHDVDINLYYVHIWYIFQFIPIIYLTSFLDALASLDLKLSVSESPFFTASASTGLSELFFQLTLGFSLASPLGLQ